MDFTNIPKYYKELPHQKKALKYLMENVDPKVLEEFEEIWRNPPKNSDQLSANFAVSELIKSQTALRYNIRNYPGKEQFDNLRELCLNVLQPVRDNFNRPVIISSGYRSPSLNHKIGGSRTSQHCSGQAADFEIPGLSNLTVAKWIKANLDFDQLILEFYNGKDPNSGWIHCSYTTHRRNRKQSLVYNGGTYRKW